ncbi:MAG: VanZ family protein [Dehalococcoidia bacterium]
MRREPLRRWSMLAALAVAGVIVVLTLVVSPAEGDPMSRLIPAIFTASRSAGADTCVGGIPCQDGHALAFLALALFASVHVAAAWSPRRQLTRLVGLFVLLVAFAAIDEFAQGWTGRDPSFADWLADTAGILLGVLVGAQLTRFLVRG